MDPNQIISLNRAYWDANAADWFGTTALPELGVNFLTEEQAHIFDPVENQKMLEICCGSGHSLLYNARRGAAELWGVDLSRSQLDNARRLLDDNSVRARLICSPMESLSGIPGCYFDCVYSIYGMGWCTDLPGVFANIFSYLKPGGSFIFSWHHPMNCCVAFRDGQRWDIMRDQGPIMTRSYFDESPVRSNVNGDEIIYHTHMISTWVNTLISAGFVLERILEQTDPLTLSADPGDPRVHKAQMLPLSVCFKARRPRKQQN